MTSAKPKIVLYDVHATDTKYFSQAFDQGFEAILTGQPLSEKSVELAADAEVIAVHVTSPVTDKMIDAMPNLKHIACRTTGFDYVDTAYAKAHGITVSTVPSYGEDTVAEYAFLLLLAISRRLMLAAHSVHAGLVNPEKLTGHDLNGKTLGVIGTGRIGRNAARIARGFGMTVIAYDPYPNDKAATEIGFTYVALPELFERADCITLHAPATPESTHILNADAFAKMKTGVLLVNTARGTLVDTPALIDALNSGKVGAVGLDVLEGEEFLQYSAELRLMDETELGDDAKVVLGIDLLTKMPNVLITSHNAYNSIEALGRIRETSVSNIIAWQSHKPQNLLL
jgi:D-lactate dehydrogenase